MSDNSRVDDAAPTPLTREPSDTAQKTDKDVTAVDPVPIMTRKSSSRGERVSSMISKFEPQKSSDLSETTERATATPAAASSSSTLMMRERSTSKVREMAMKYDAVEKENRKEKIEEKATTAPTTTDLQESLVGDESQGSQAHQNNHNEEKGIEAEESIVCCARCCIQ